jgi:hypothetical protein
VTLEALQHACDQITHELQGWPGVCIERQQVFVRTDGIPISWDEIRETPARLEATS